MARPTEYSQDIIVKGEEYLNSLPPDEVVHSIEGLALYLNIHRSTVYTWKDEEGKEEFSDIVERVLSKQSKSLVNKGLSGDFTPQIAKVMMTKHGYREGVDHTTNDKDLPFAPGVVEKRASDILTPHESTATKG